MPNIVCVVAGPVVGLRSAWFLEDCVSLAEKAGRKLVVFDFFDELLQQEGFKPRNAFERISCIGGLVDAYQYQFRLMREKAYLSVSRRIFELGDDVNVILRVPLTIEWRGFVHEFKDYRSISQWIKPDRVITLIDAEWKIYGRLLTDYGKYAVKKVTHAEDRVSIGQILRWLGSEVSRSEDLAAWAEMLTGKKVEHYVLGIETPGFFDRSFYVRDIDNMVKFATERNLLSFYVSYSMTVAKEDVREEINEALCRLRNYGAVIDPASIEIQQDAADEDEDATFSYTVCRDLQWYVKKTDIVAAFHPYEDMPPLSTGMMDELGHAKAFFKERYFVLGSGAGSPFTGGNFVPKENLFKRVEDFFDYIENKRTPAIRPELKAVADGYAHYQKEVMEKKKKMTGAMPS